MTKGPAHRFFAELSADEARGEVRLSGPEAHHALHVLRLKAGAAVELFDGRGRVADGVVDRVQHGEVVVAVEDVQRLPPPGGPHVHVAFAVPKGKRLDWLLEKATELAAASLRPVVFERSVAGRGEFATSKRERWLGHCVAAAKQCGLNFLPELRAAATLSEYLAGLGGAAGLFGDASAAAEPVGTAVGRLTGDDVHVLIGPEGGLTDEERSAARAARLVPVRLGHTTLRIETAAVALLAAIVAMGC